MKALDIPNKTIENSPRWLTILVTHAVFWSLYAYTSRHPLFAPRELPFLPGERSIPCLGWTSYVYLSLLLEIPLAMFLLPKEGYGRVVCIGAGIVMLHVLVFVCFPTVYPRAGRAGHWAIGIIWSADRPTNAFPSLHVALSSYLAFAVWRMRRRIWGASLLVWAVAIAVSTLTVKQHYVLDSLAGMAVAFIAAGRIRVAVPAGTMRGVDDITRGATSRL